MYGNTNSNSYPNSDSSIEVRVKDCKADLKSLIASLQPYAPLDEIDIPRLDRMIDLIRDYILLFDPVVNQTDPGPMDECDIAFLEQACKSASTVYKSLSDAIGQLRTARKALKTINDSITETRGFNVALQNDCFVCYENCRQMLATAFKNIII